MGGQSSPLLHEGEGALAIASGVEPTYSGTFVGARRYVLDMFANESAQV